MDQADRSTEMSRGDLDRVIRRAVELQFEESTDRVSTHRLDEAEVVRIGAEVGIEERFVRRALGELRADRLLPAPPEDTGPLARLVGVAVVRAHRVVPGTLDAVEADLGEHLRTRETLSPVRSRHGQSVWEPHPGVFAELRRALRFQGYRYELSRVTGLHVTLAPMEDGFVLVSLAADLRRSRTENAFGWGFGLASGAGVAAGAVALILGAPLLAAPLLALPAAVAGGFLGARVARGPFRKIIERTAQAAEGILDRLEAGEPPTSGSRLGSRRRGGRG